MPGTMSDPYDRFKAARSGRRSYTFGIATESNNAGRRWGFSSIGETSVRPLGRRRDRGHPRRSDECAEIGLVIEVESAIILGPGVVASRRRKNNVGVKSGGVRQ